MDSNTSIGIFDSGIGGLTVANAILNELPNERIIYFGDTAHLPYGDKSASAIQYYARNITNFLSSKNCKVIVIACNTASAVAYDLLQKIVPKDVFVINVIDPVVEYIINKGYKKVGVIGTIGTIGSNIYKFEIKEKNTKIKVKQLATPLLASMIETGFINGQISQLIIEDYLQKPEIQDIDTLVLGCTHYPLIKKEIEAYYKQQNLQVDVLATNEIVGAFVKKYMVAEGIIRYEKSEEEHQFFVSDFTETFAQTTRMFYGKDIKLEEVRLFD
ncbi:MAG: glutamate racemase [Chitinophagales bacterium]|jgi:glutamate racemase